MTADSPRSALREVSKPTATVSTLGFVGLILALVGVGLGAVIVITTQVGAQSKELAALREETTVLAYQSAALESQLQRASSANALAFKAAQLGMVPNPYPAFINLADGSITGEPTKVSGDEMPMLRGKAQPVAPVPTPEIVEPSQTPEAPAPEPETTPDPDQPPVDMVAGGAAGE